MEGHYVLHYVKSLERASVLLKSSTRYFQNGPPFERSACFYATFSENLERFQYWITAF